MKKTIAFLSLILVCLLCSCNSPKKPSPKTLETERKLVGKWKFLFSDAAEQIPPKDLIYTLNADHTSLVEFTNDKDEKNKIEGEYKVEEDWIIFFKEGKESTAFQVEFQGDDTVRFTERKTKNSMTLARLRE